MQFAIFIDFLYRRISKLIEGKATVATMVHHIRPLREGGTNDEENLMALCNACHSRLHARRGDRWHDR